MGAKSLLSLSHGLTRSRNCSEKKKKYIISDSRLLPKCYNYYLTADSITTLNRDVFLRLNSFFLSPPTPE